MMRFDEERTSGPAAGVCLWVREAAGPSYKMNQDSAVAFTNASPIDQLTTNNSSRDRQATRPAGAQPDRLPSQNQKTILAWVSQAHREEFRPRYSVSDQMVGNILRPLGALRLETENSAVRGSRRLSCFWDSRITAGISGAAEPSTLRSRSLANKRLSGSVASYCFSARRAEYRAASSSLLRTDRISSCCNVSCQRPAPPRLYLPARAQS